MTTPGCNRCRGHWGGFRHERKYVRTFLCFESMHYTIQQMARVCLPVFKQTFMPSDFFFILHQEEIPKHPRPAIVVEDDHDFMCHSEECSSYGTNRSLDTHSACSEEERDIAIESVDLNSIIDQYKHMGLGTADSFAAFAETAAMDNNNDDDDDDEWSCLTDGDDDASAFEWIVSAVQDDLESQSNVSQSWEITSEVNSVMTLEDSIGATGKVSYADMAKTKAGSPREDPGKKASLQKTPQRIPTIQEEELLSNQDNNETCDAFFVLEGVKGGHGGKPAMRFRGNQKTQKCRRRERRRR